MKERLPIIEKLFEIRTRLGLSRDAVSRLCGVPSGNIYRYEKQNMKPCRIYQLAIEKFIKASRKAEAKREENANI